MKQIIVLCACLPLALILILQIGVTTTNNSNAIFVQTVVEEAAEEARYDGCFTNENIDSLKTTISEKLDIPKEEIIVNATGESDVKYKSSHYNSGNSEIEYSITVPIKKIIAAPKFFGISTASNSGIMIKEGSILSERLAE